MFKSKASRLVSEEGAKKQYENFYESQKCRWTEYISRTALVGFMLLIILTNIDLTGNVYATTIATAVATNTSITNESQNWKAILNMNNVRSDRTNCYDKNYCHITCTGGTIENLHEEIGSLASRCAQTVEVHLEYCKFYTGRMDAKFFASGNYRLASFTINDCDLAEFEANTFVQPTVADLTNMTFIKTNIKTLNERTFLGLNSLEYFKMINNKIYTTFNGVGFLEPISDTITEVVVQQLSDKNKKYDPTNWLISKKDQIKLLKVDLSGNIFYETLTSATFANLVQVQRLILSNCYITTIGFGTFDKIIKTLTYLDLSNNQLTTLSGDFLAGNSLTGFHMELYDNAWNCVCENYELVKFTKKPEIEFTVEPKCSTPDEFKNTNIKLITIDCDDEATTVEVKTTTKTTQSTMTTKTTEPTTTEITSTSDDNEETTQYTESDPTDETYDTTETLKTTVKVTPSLPTPLYPTRTTTTYKTPIWTADTTELSTVSTAPTDETDETTQYTDSTDYETNPPNLPDMDYQIKCEKTPTTYPVLRKYDELFSIEPISSTSVRVVLEKSVKNLNLIYFTPEAKYAQIININSSEFITDLTTNVDYVFCLISYDEDEISPFNCRSQHLIESPKEAWLLHSDTALFISLSALAVAICVICGIAAVYWTLRWRPTWSIGNKRLIKISSMTNEVFLLPKDEVEQQNIFRELDRLHSPVNDKNSYLYMQFNKNLELHKLRKPQYSPESIPPTEYAPTIPRNNRYALQHSSMQPKQFDVNLMSKSDYDNEYESVDYYEQIF